MNTGYSDSDTSDEDYNPSKEKTEVLSEEDSNDESEEACSDSEETINKGKKRRKTKQGKKKRKQTLKVIEEPESEKEEKVVKPEDDKKRVDALWADFMKDTGFKPRSELLKSESKPKESSKPPVQSNGEPKDKEIKKEEKIKVTQVFEFAGEEVKVVKEVSVSSLEAKTLEKVGESSSNPSSSRKPRGGGLSSVLSQIGKKNKISTLEKTKLDWDRFKKEEKLEDELNAYGKSKDGYLERQDFLQRADLRQFEIEKGVRNTLRANRINNIP